MVPVNVLKTSICTLLTTQFMLASICVWKKKIVLPYLFSKDLFI